MPPGLDGLPRAWPSRKFRCRRNRTGQSAADPLVKVIRVVKRIPACLTEWWTAADHGVLCKRSRRAWVAPIFMDVLGSLNAPEQPRRYLGIRDHVLPHVLDAGRLPATWDTHGSIQTHKKAPQYSENSIILGSGSPQFPGGILNCLGRHRRGLRFGRLQPLGELL